MLVLGNVQPIQPGHKVIIPRRAVPRTADLTDAELDDLWQSVRTAVTAVREDGAEAANVAIADGQAAGQVVPHVHAHVVPRRQGDFEQNDDVYEAISSWRPPWLASAGAAAKLEVPPDEERRNRSPEEMAAEATTYRELLAATGSPELGAVPQETQMFARIPIDAGQQFFASASGLTVGFVNLKPLVPGHVLLVPRRQAALLGELEDAELADLFWSVRFVQAALERHYGASASLIGIQDGRSAGQTVPHVHVHILPRRLSG